MVGRVNDPAVADAIFKKYIRKYIAEMSDERLETVAANTIWLCETKLHGPHSQDALQRDIVRAECERREKPEIFQRAEEQIFRQTRHQET